MKVVNIMNFVRYIDERRENSIQNQFDATKKELELVNEFGVKNTFLLQYDALCDENYQKLFKENATENTELGIWFEIVEPLAAKCSIPYNSKMGWKWDWHITPGFSMAYTKEQREVLVDEVMRKFKEVFGYYPKTFASWVIDTHTINYITENYDISAIAICREQVGTDAYTLVGGYFNQAYYPSKNNIFTPAQTEDMRINVPVFRLLGPCPIHNYEYKKYMSEKWQDNPSPYTLEPGWDVGRSPETVDWFFKTYFENEDLGFSYAQLGQENSFGAGVVPALRMQLEKILKYKDVEIQKMCETGEWFKKTYKEKTPATSVTALDNWDTEDVQAVYFDCEKYTSNIMRYKDKVFIRELFIFDERVKDIYIEDTCKTFDAVFENLPVIDNLNWCKDEKSNCGLVIDESASSFNAEKIEEGVLKVYWADKAVIFSEEKIIIVSDKLKFYVGKPACKISLEENKIVYDYKGNTYCLRIENAELEMLSSGDIEITTACGKCELYIEC